MVEVLKRLAEARGVTGNENEVRDIILELARPLADECYVDRIGNVIAKKKGSKGGRKVMIAAHMDEIGFIISRISDNGMLRFLPVGGIDQRILVSKRVLVGKDRVPGVIGVKAIHLQEPDERRKVINQKQMYIDIGARSREEAEKVVKIGDYASFDSDFVCFGDNKVKSKALDDRAGCSILLELLKDTYECDLYACFTVQEEIGLRGLRSLPTTSSLIWAWWSRGLPAQTCPMSLTTCIRPGWARGLPFPLWTTAQLPIRTCSSGW